jgi:glyoxylase I family protein
MTTDTRTPGVAPLNRVQHVTLCVTDEAQSRAFYTQILGLPEAERPPLRVAGLWLQVGATQIHLLVPPDPSELPRPRQLDRTPIAPHLAFEVPALEPVVSRLRAQGITVILSEFVEGQAFFTDPSGNILELNAPVGAGRGVP